MIPEPQVLAIGLDAHEIATASQHCILSVIDEPLESLFDPTGYDFHIIDSADCIITSSAYESQFRELLNAKGVSTPILRYEMNCFESVISIIKESNKRSTEICRLARELASLRGVHEALHRSYASLRDLAYNEGLSVPRLQFFNDVSKIEEQCAAICFEQRLPIDLNSLCAVSLFFEKHLPQYSSRTVFIEIGPSDDNGVFHRWRRPLARLNMGWHTFAMTAEVPVTAKRNAILRVSLDGPTDECRLILGLGTQVARGYMGHIADGVQSDKALAMKCWTGLAGIPLSYESSMLPVHREAGYPIDRLEIVFATFNLIDRSDFSDAQAEPIKLVGGDKWLLVSPTSRGPTIAELQSAVPEGTTRVRAWAANDSNEGACEFCIAIGIGADVIMGDWVKLEPMTSTMLTLKPTRANIKRCSLFLLTRVKRSSVTYDRLSYFKRVVVEGDF